MGCPSRTEMLRTTRCSALEVSERLCAVPLQCPQSPREKPRPGSLFPACTTSRLPQALPSLCPEQEPKLTRDVVLPASLPQLEDSSLPGLRI